MNICPISLITITIMGFLNVVWPARRLTVVTNSPLEFLHKEYKRVQNQDPPFELDPAAGDAMARLRICSEINESGVFSMYPSKYEPVDAREIRTELKHQQQYSRIFRHVYPTNKFDPQDDDEYTNPYRLWKFRYTNYLLDGLEVRQDPLDVKEYVFLCFLRETRNDAIIPFYVSKAYNMLHDHRFIFLPEEPDRMHSPVWLAERSSNAYLKTDFNVELHYLEMKKYHKEVAETLEHDPVCKLHSGELEDDQGFRLCTIILGSSYFKAKVVYPRRSRSNAWVCYRLAVSFRTEEGKKRAEGKLYDERMIRCYAILDDGSESFYYISRAYNPHQVFVYAIDPVLGNVYLEILSTDVSIVHEPYDFGNIEV